MRRLHLRRGDVYRLPPGTVFFVDSGLEPEREKLRIHAIFAGSGEDLHERSIGAYSSINDMLLGFDPVILQSAFQVSEGVIEGLTSRVKPPAIVHGVPKTMRSFWEWEEHFMNLFTKGGQGMYHLENKKKKISTFNIQDADKDVENCNGWSLTVTRKNLHALKGSEIGVFMVNLTKGAMMGPHWNPTATEISMALKGQGMVQVVCPSTANISDCQNKKFRVEEGDIFAVPRLHPMAQIAFNNDSFAFLGFSTTSKKNYPQFLAGQASVLHALDKNVLAAAFNASNATIDQLLSPQAESIILECTSCAEKLEKIMEEEIEREKEEAEEKKREEEEAKRRKEKEEARKRAEEDAKKREKEEARKKQEEEAQKREEEARKKEEEEAKRQEKEREEKERQQEEEAQREREKEEEAQREREREEEAQREREREEQAQREREKEKEAERQREEAAQREREREEEAEREWEKEEEARREEKEREEREKEEAGRPREEETKEREPSFEGRRFLWKLRNK
ncbi:Cupin 1 [Dillenia turbinata]|uniref:Cupin 1 n=1 Tax=Dillenia turbinata TaxID=194707 RepID=A0AAN8UYH9_9MAGN